MHLIKSNEIEIAQNRLETIIKSLENEEYNKVKQIFNYLQPKDVAWVISNIPAEQRIQCVKVIGSSLHPNVISYLSRPIRKEVLNNIIQRSYLDYSMDADVSHEDFIQHHVFQVMRYALSGQKQHLQRIFDLLKPADGATILEFLSSSQRNRVINLLGHSFPPEILGFIDTKIRSEILDSLTYETLIHFLAELSKEDIIEILQDIDTHKQPLILHSISKLIDKDDFKLIKRSLSYGRYTAGRIMSPGIACSTDSTVYEAYNKLCITTKMSKYSQNIYIYDRNSDISQFKLVGQLGLQDLCRLMSGRSSRSEPVYKYMEEIPCILNTSTQVSEIGFLFKKYYVPEMPVVNPKNHRLMGIITATQALDILEREIGGEILTLAGLHNFDFHESVRKTIFKRIQHLGIASVATIASVSVIHLFESTIRESYLLAILMPIAPAVGGNAANQVLTVTVRAISNREIARSNIWRTIKKEVSANLGGGILIGLSVGILCVLYYKNWKVGLILAIALMLNICWAGLLGSGLPILLDQYDRDPALASVFLNVATDIFGYAVLLGMAKMFL